MLLTKKQYKSQQEVFTKIANKIQEMQEETRKNYENNSDKNAFTTAIYMGKASALTDAYNFLRSAFDLANKNEKYSSDNLLINTALQFHINIKAINDFLNEMDPTSQNVQKIKDQLNIMENTLKEMTRILKQIE